MTSASSAIDRAGTLVASAATDNSIRIWRADSEQPLPFTVEIEGDAVSGSEQPLPFTVEIEGDAVSGMAFSPNAALLAVQKGAGLLLLNVADGSTIGEFELGEGEQRCGVCSKRPYLCGRRQRCTENGPTRCRRLLVNAAVVARAARDSPS
jgi:hypothetical protein